MNRLTRLLLHSPESRLLRHHLRRPPPSLTKTLPPSPNPILPTSQNCLFCSGVSVVDPFASLKCYTVSDPDTPYYVMEVAPLDVERREAGGVCMDGLVSGKVEHLVCVSASEGDSSSCDVYLVGIGTDKDSNQDAKLIINHLKPKVVFLELCASRRSCVTQDKVKGGRMIQAKHTAIRLAFEEAMYNSNKVVLGDRPFDVTVRRILESMLAMGIWEFTRLSFFLMYHFLDYGKNNKVFNINEFVRHKIEDLKAFTGLLQPAIHERDLYMTAVLAKIAREHASVVAVVGKDHVPGIKKQLEQTVMAWTHCRENNNSKLPVK